MRGFGAAAPACGDAAPIAARDSSAGGAGDDESPCPSAAACGAHASIDAPRPPLACGAPRPYLAIFAPPIGDLPHALPMLVPHAAIIDLSGQALPEGSGDALGRMPMLADLQLRSCSMQLETLRALLRTLRAPRAPALRALGVSDVRVTDAGAGVEVGAEVAAVGLPVSLRSLSAALVSFALGLGLGPVYMDCAGIGWAKVVGLRHEA